MEYKHLTKEEAENFFSGFYNGKHHIQHEIKNYGEGWCVNHLGSFATFDFSELTRLVVMAHDCCIRVEVAPASSKYLKICIWKRQGREGEMSLRHPELPDSIGVIREKLSDNEDYKSLIA